MILSVQRKETNLFQILEALGVIDDSQQETEEEREIETDYRKKNTAYKWFPPHCTAPRRGDWKFILNRGKKMDRKSKMGSKNQRELRPQEVFHVCNYNI